MSRQIDVTIVEEPQLDIYVARVQYVDRVEEISNVDECVFEWIHEYFDKKDEDKGRGFYFQRTDGGTLLSREGAQRIDVVKQEPKV